MTKIQRSDTEKNNLIENGTRKGIDEVVRQMYNYKVMLSYCLKNNAENKNLRVSKHCNNITILLQKCAICGTKTSKFIKKQERSRILSGLDLKIL